MLISAFSSNFNLLKGQYNYEITYKDEIKSTLSGTKYILNVLVSFFLQALDEPLWRGESRIIRRITCKYTCSLNGWCPWRGGGWERHSKQQETGLQDLDRKQAGASSTEDTDLEALNIKLLTVWFI